MYKKYFHIVMSRKDIKSISKKYLVKDEDHIMSCLKTVSKKYNITIDKLIEILLLDVKIKDTTESIKCLDMDCIKESKLPLFEYQKIVCRELEKKRGLIVVHSVGAGKTLTSTTASKCFLDQNKGSMVYVVTPAGLIDNFKKEMEAYGLQRTDPRYVFYSHAKFVKDLKENVLPMDILKNNMIIIDEIHNFRTPLTKDQVDEYLDTIKPKYWREKEYEDEEFVKYYKKIARMSVDCKKGYISRQFMDKMIKKYNLKIDKFDQKIIKKTDEFLAKYDINKPRKTKFPPGSYYMIEACLYAKKVLGLTATPIVNTKSDLENLLSIIRGERLYNNRRGLNYIELSRGLFSFYERAKDDPRFPSYKVYNVNIKMNDSYYKEYSTALKYENQNYAYSNEPHFYHLQRQATAHIDDRLDSPKVDWAVRKTVETVKKGGKVVIFSLYIDSGIEMISKRLKKENIKYAYISGEVSKKDRVNVVRDYNSGDVPVLVISKAGGEGLDLKETAVFIMMEPAWNYAVEIQAIGRTVRSGSHVNLPPDKRHVDCYLLFMIVSKDNNPKNIRSGDQILYEYVKRKMEIIKKSLAEISKTSIENKTFVPWSPTREVLNI